MLRDQIQDDIKQAMRDKNAVKLETLRFVWSETKNVEIDAKHTLDDVEMTKLLQKEVKKRKEAIELFKKGNREELATAEVEKLKIIQAYLPEEMSQEEVGKVVDEVIASGSQDFGAVMGQVMGKLKGQADGKLVGAIVKEKLV